tara:strand:+ start:634 stop:1197 length:564 start_codon:yes stop_codon:yes gene_type:complete
MRTETLKIYKFSELSENAKDKAREAHREHIASDTFWSEPLEEDILHALNMVGFGVDIDITMRYAQGDGVKLIGTYAYETGGLKQLRTFAPSHPFIPLIQELQGIQRRNFYQIHGSIGESRWCPYDFECDYHELSETDLSRMKEITQSLESMIFHMFRDEYEYATSDSAIDEYILAHDCEFLSCGTPH